MTHKPVHILLADDHCVVKSGLKLVINGYYADYKLSFAANFKEIFESIDQHTFDMLILDASFPEGNTLSIIEKIIALKPDIKILIYSALEENIFAPKFLGLGTKGFLSKMANEDEIIAAVTKVLDGDIYMSKILKEKMLDGLIKKTAINPFDKLSQREFEIMLLLVDGDANLEISNKLEIKPSTSSTYKNRIYEKLDVSNISELITLYKLYHT